MAVPDRSRKRPESATTHVATVGLRVTSRDAKTLHAAFHTGTRLYNAALEEALQRARALRADPEFARLKALEPGPDRTAAFHWLDLQYGFTAAALQAYLNGVRHRYPGHALFAHEVQALADQAFGAVARWHFGHGGRPRFKSIHRGLHALTGKDRHSAIQPVTNPAGHLVAIRWGRTHPFAVAWPKIGGSRRAHQQQAERARVETLLAAGALRACRIVRTPIRGRWVYTAQLVFDGPPPVRHPVGAGPVSLDMGPSMVHWVGPSGPGHHDALAPGVLFAQRTMRRVSRHVDRCHRRESPACFDDRGRHRSGGCLWRERSREAQNAQARLAEAHRVLAARRRTEHGTLLNRLLAVGTRVRCEAQRYTSWQRTYGRSVRDRAPGQLIAQLRRKAVSAGGELYTFSPRTTALSQVCVCTRQVKKPLAQRWHACPCGVEADRDLFSAFLGLHVHPDADGQDRLDSETAQRAYASRRQDLACKPGVEGAGWAPGKPRVRPRRPSGRRALVRIAKRLGRTARGVRADGAVRKRPRPVPPTGATRPAGGGLAK